MFGISVWAFVDLLKMSMEGTTEEAYFASSSEKLLSISGEKVGRLVGCGKKASWRR
jgi:hypothetical protein